MDLSIIVLTFNAKDITIKMFESLRVSLDYVDEVDKLNYEVIVVDNGSTDGIADEIDRKINWAKLIRNENVGFSKGNNTGIENINKNSKYVLFLNPDIILEKESIYKMYLFMKNHNGVGLATCRVDLWSGGLDWDCHRGFPTPWRSFCYFTGLEKMLGNLFPNVFGGYHLLDLNMNQNHEIDSCMGAFMIIPREIGEKVLWWSTDYFLNGEDIDLCYKIKEIEGYKIMYVPDTKVIHYKGASKGTKKQSSKITKATKSTKNLQINSGIQAMEIFYRKYYINKYPKIINIIVFMGIWILHKKRLLLGKE